MCPLGIQENAAATRLNASVEMTINICCKQLLKLLLIRVLWIAKEARFPEHNDQTDLISES